MSHINSVDHLAKTAIFNSESTLIHGMNLLCLRADTAIINPYYAFHYLNSSIFLNQIPKITKNSVNQASFNVTNLKKLKILVPPIENQKKIVEVLDEAQKLIDKRKEQIGLLDDLIQSIFYDMFGDPVKNDKGWEIRTLDQIAKGKLSYGSGASAIEYDGFIRYIRITDINDNGTLNDSIVSPSEISEKYTLNDGDILFARSGATVGKTLRYKISFGKCIFAGYLIRLIPNQTVVHPDYIYYFTKTDYYKRFIESNIKVVAQPNINAKQYGGMEVILPPLSIQNQFAKKVELIEKQKALMEQSLKLMEENYNSLMQRAFNGELF